MPVYKADKERQTMGWGWFRRSTGQGSALSCKAWNGLNQKRQAYYAAMARDHNRRDETADILTAFLWKA